MLLILVSIGLIILAILSIKLGISSIRKANIPLSPKKNLTGTPARLIGVLLILFAGGVCYFGIDIFPRLLGAKHNLIQIATVPHDLLVTEWSRHSTPDGVMSAEFPGTPFKKVIGRKELEALVEIENPEELEDFKLDKLELDRPGEGGVYSLTATFIKNTKQFDNAIDAWKSEITDFIKDYNSSLSTGQPKGKIASDNEISVQGQNGREIVFELEGRSSINQLFIHNGFVYRANVVIKKELKDGPAIKKFFESIQLNLK
jgi:hypothetical protein